ncbi:MAG TPA: formate dehydrogenase accessory sulfurtransferase FdhD [Methanotrichaceae archaeon]|nr:formate dehydrogenase accessory sulfurtransferase FdhD [Methanotrichaceae archaeon]
MKHQALQTLRIEGVEIFEIEERLPREIELEIFVNGDFFAKATITPSQEREFVAGHLWYRGMIEDASQIKSLRIEGNRAWADIEPASEKVRWAETKSTSGKADWSVRADWILSNLLATLDSDLYGKTGGTHTSSLCRGESILASSEDVGRLNPLDKAFGWGILRGWDLRSCYAVTSGRITSHTVEKVSKFNVPLVASKGAVTTLAVEMAEKWGMTLVGFARQSRMNVYTRRDRVTLK